MKICRAGLHEYPEDKKQCPQCAKDTNRRYYQNNKSKCKMKATKWWLENKDKHNQSVKKWELNNKEQRQLSIRKYEETNKAQIRITKNRYQRVRKRNDPLWKLRCDIAVLVNKSYKNQGYSKSSKTANILGCDFETLRKHLITSAMNNYGKYYSPLTKYQLDHVIPVSSATTEEELIKLNHYTNLQYLTPEDNLAKSDSLSWTIADSVTLNNLNQSI